MHNIPVAPELAYLGELFKSAGARLYAVGGMIRSPLVGQPVTDIDTCSRLRPEEVISLCEKNGLKSYYPSPILCTDNAAMIGAAAYYEYCKGVRSGLDLNAVPNLRLGER